MTANGKSEKPIARTADWVTAASLCLLLASLFHLTFQERAGPVLAAVAAVTTLCILCLWTLLRVLPSRCQGAVCRLSWLIQLGLPGGFLGLAFGEQSMFVYSWLVITIGVVLLLLLEAKPT